MLGIASGDPKLPPYRLYNCLNVFFEKVKIFPLFQFGGPTYRSPHGRISWRAKLPTRMSYQSFTSIIYDFQSTVPVLFTWLAVHILFEGANGCTMDTTSHQSTNKIMMWQAMICICQLFHSFWTCSLSMSLYASVRKTTLEILTSDGSRLSKSRQR